MKIISPPRSGRLGDVVFVNSRYGELERQFVVPRNPRTAAQQRNRSNFGALASRYRGFTPDQRAAWALAAAHKYKITFDGRRVALNGFSYYMSINNKRAFLGLPLFEVPPPEPSFSPNPVAELVATNDGDKITLKVRVPSQPAQYTLVQGAAPVSAGVRCVQHFPFLGLLAPATDGWSEVTDLYVARYGMPIVGMVVFIRICQHIDGRSDVPKEFSVLIPAPS
jgi:hypothetical protein